MLTQSRLKEVLDYDINTGCFFWKQRTSTSIHIGDMAGSIDDSGYIVIIIDYNRYKGQNLAFLYMTGKFPKYILDHKNGDLIDNKFSNLREATRSNNMHNAARRIDNTSGIKGLSWEKSKQTWKGTIMLNNKSYQKRSRDKTVVIDWLITTREYLHGEFANHGTT